MARANEPEEIYAPMLPQLKKPYSYYESPYVVNQIHFYLSQEIGAPDQYVDMIHRILVAGEHDVVYIHLNTPGGRLDTGVQLINAISNTAAKVVTCLESEAHSLGTLLFLSGDEMVINEHCMMMFHNYSGGVGGKGHEQVAHLAAETKRMYELMHKIYVPFLTTAEVDRIIDGADIWMSSEEIKVRLDKMIKALTEESAPAPKKPPRSRKTSNKSTTGEVASEK